ncbi:unnamed protein product [Cuscuta campestris]|uniref:Potassium channel domain-containing protein n=1 Tax=Cuscuta campestris TaxID=132261 RepID=A0A484M772_9ASTE|nr:unnamed protein product [Cuscuta campestris]
MENLSDVNEALLKRSLDPSLEYRQNGVFKRRRLCRTRSAPLVDYLRAEVNGSVSNQYSESLDYTLRPSLKKVAAYLSIYLGVGTICFYAIRYQISGKKTNPIVDALYFCMVTMTTVGYGDLVPKSSLAKLLACAFVFSGMALGGLILSNGADYLVEKQEALVVRALHMRKKMGPSDIIKEIDAHKTGYKLVLVLVFLAILFISGTIFLNLVEGLDFIDAFYCVCVTISTLGYGDRSFSTEGGRIFAVLWILTSTINLGLFFLYIAELNTEKRRKALVKRVLNRPLTNVDLEAADIDEDGTVGAAEFVLYKLKEMGKITQEDISLVLEEFEVLDIDQSGTLSLSDITLAQSSATQVALQTSDKKAPP